MENILILEEVTSTNEYLKQHYKQLPDGTVVMAKRQTKGKGRLSRVWKSESGNLYLSILKKEVDRRTIFYELMNVSVSLINVLNRYNIEAVIKYPNDVIVGLKKISGILMESSGYDVLDYLIIGIGLNINQSNFEELSSKATSMYLESSSMQKVESIANELLKTIKEEKDVYQKYLTHSYVIGKELSYQGDMYTVIGITSQGSLKLKGRNEIHVPLNELSLEELYE